MPPCPPPPKYALALYQCTIEPFVGLQLIHRLCFELLVSDSSGGYLVGTKMSMADVILFEALLLVDEEMPQPLQDKYPHSKVRRGAPA